MWENKHKARQCSDAVTSLLVDVASRWGSPQCTQPPSINQELNHSCEREKMRGKRQNTEECAPILLPSRVQMIPPPLPPCQRAGRRGPRKDALYMSNERTSATTERYSATHGRQRKNQYKTSPSNRVQPVSLWANPASSWSILGIKRNQECMLHGDYKALCTCWLW